MKRLSSSFIIGVAIVLALGASISASAATQNNKKLAERILVKIEKRGKQLYVNAADLKRSILSAAAPLDVRIARLEKTVKTLEEHIRTLTNELRELKSGQSAMQEGSREEILPSIVGAASKAVVSVVVSKDVPQLERVLINPFENDPRFQGLDIRVPAYRQKGVERQKVGAGTGFFTTPDGYIVTNKHVVADASASYTVLLSDGTQKNALVSYRDPKHDIALIKIDDGNYPVITLSNSDTLQLGQGVIAIGNALGEFGNTISVGVVSGLKRTISAKDNNNIVQKLENVIQTDAAINPGNSGGPLLDFAGRAVGVNVATVIGSENIGFALPINELRDILATALKQ